MRKRAFSARQARLRLHFLTALCCAHNDISLYFACSFTSVRQVAVACFTAALSDWSWALTSVGANGMPHAITATTVLHINDCPSFAEFPCDSSRKVM